MKHNVLLIVISLLSILLFSIHVTDDIVRGMDDWGPENILGVFILVVWLYGTLVLPARRSGQVIMLLGGIFAALMPVIHMRGTAVTREFARSSGAFFFLWTLLVIGAIGTLSAILAVRAMRRNVERQSETPS